MSRRDQVRELYGFEFPDDLFRFWEFATRLRPLEPWNAFFDLFEFQLVGPFDILAGRFDGRTLAHPATLHWRYFSDPPEFFTLFVGGEGGLHWGYYFDDPPGGTRCVASYFGEEEMDLTIEGEGIFDAVRLHLEETYRDVLESVPDAGSDADWCRGELARLDSMRDQLMEWATAARPEIGGSYSAKYRSEPSARESSVVAATMDGMGVVAPAETYRPLSITDEELWEALWHGVPRGLVEEAERALAEGCPATASKLGKDLWATGSEEHLAVGERLMRAGYSALGRETLADVLRAHRLGRDREWLDVLAEGPSGCSE